MVGRIDETPMLLQQAAYLVITGLLLGAMLRFELLELEREEQAATQQISDVLSQHILRAPEHWLWMAPGREP